MKLKITIVLLVLSSILFFYVYKRDVSPGVKIDFKEKKNLSVDAYAFAEKFIRFQTKPGEYKDLDIVLWNISKNEVVKKLFTVTRERRIEKAFVVKPDETSIFVSSKDTIYQVSTIDGHLLNQLDIPNLQTGENGGKCELDRLIFASNEKLWFTIANEGFFSDGSVFEWNFSQGSKCIMTNLVSEGEGQFYRIACDYSEKNTWFYFSQDGLINIPIGVIGKRDDLLTDHQFVDYSKEKGWLLSIALFDATNKDDDKIYYISSSGSGIELTEGNLAVWGNDDFVYFYRENTDLWRISISTKKEDLIFKPEKVSFTRRCRRDYFPPLFNKEKNLLIFSYQKSVFSHSPIEGVEKFPSNSAIIFDFKNKIYINYDNLHFVSLKWKE